MNISEYIQWTCTMYICIGKVSWLALLLEPIEDNLQASGVICIGLIGEDLGYVDVYTFF